MRLPARAALALLAGLALPVGGEAQVGAPATPAPDAADVATMDGIIEALYASISGPAGPRQWTRFESLFLPGAILMNAGPRPDSVLPQPSSPAQYRAGAEPYFAQNAFYEVEAARQTHRYGTVATAWSTYESRRDPDADPFTRGINSITMVWHADRWWITAIIWDFERPDNPIPPAYEPGG
jgi:hypothetical protein